MPKILSRQPAWLDHGRPAYDLFQPDPKSKARPQPAGAYHGPSKKIAHRGTEVFVAVGTELRWTDLGVLKDKAEGENTEFGYSAGQRQSSNRGYKILQAPVARPIEQLSVSPSGDYIAVLTSHTCHVCLIPATEQLRFQDPTPISLKSRQVGPIAHVLEQSPLVGAIWHPLSSSGNDLVTITKDACIRLWELDYGNRGTFGEPSLAVDLKKLGNATSMQEDFSASTFGTNKGFSPDDVEMEAAAACFGGSGSDDEDGWSSMTLWVTMTEGDVYALCPFLPATFWLPASHLAALSTSVVAAGDEVIRTNGLSESRNRITRDQKRWLSELDGQEPFSAPSATEIRDHYSRPSHMGAIPKLQGPFRVTPEPDFGEITDILVIAPKIDDEALYDKNEFDDYESDEGLSVGIVCLATNAGQVHVCLNLEGVEAEWLPTGPSKSTFSADFDDEEHELLRLETIELSQTGRSVSGKSTTGDWWPTFTLAPTDRYDFFSTQPTGVFSVSLRPWIKSLEDELSAPPTGIQGVNFRIGIFLESAPSMVERITSTLPEPQAEINAAIAILDSARSDLGFLVLTSSGNTVLAASLDLTATATPPYEHDAAPIPVRDPRDAYQPASIFFSDSRLSAQLQAWRQRGPPSLKGPMQLDFPTLQVMSEGHRILSGEITELDDAISGLFSQYEGMLPELQSQVDVVRELQDRIGVLIGADPRSEQDGSGSGVNAKEIQNRMEAAQQKTASLTDRVEKLRRKTRDLGGKELSLKEKAFAAEISKLQQSLSEPAPPATNNDDESAGFDSSFLSASTGSEPSIASDKDSIGLRFNAVKEIFDELKAGAENMQLALEAKSGDDESKQATLLPMGGLSEYKQRQLRRVQGMLEREDALVTAVGARLAALQVAVARQ